MEKKITGAIVKDEETGKTHAVRAKVIELHWAVRGRSESFRRSIESVEREENGFAFAGSTRGVAEILCSRKVWHDHPEDERWKSRFSVTLVGPCDSWNHGYCSGTGQKTPTAPLGSRDEVDYILETIAPYLALRPHRQEVLSVWSGARLLAKDPTKTNSSDVSRDHVITKETPSDVIVVAGGKWTTYRLMAEETVDLVLKTMRENGENVNGCKLRRATWALLERTDTKIHFQLLWHNLEAMGLVVQIQTQTCRDIWQLHTAIARWPSL